MLHFLRRRSTLKSLLQHMNGVSVCSNSLMLAQHCSGKIILPISWNDMEDRKHLVPASSLIDALLSVHRKMRPSFTSSMATTKRTMVSQNVHLVYMNACVMQSPLLRNILLTGSTLRRQYNILVSLLQGPFMSQQFLPWEMAPHLAFAWNMPRWRQDYVRPIVREQYWFMVLSLLIREEILTTGRPGMSLRYLMETRKHFVRC
mmetsp:Transcript_28106/g.47649  ORF Transcript_28106/g.47649 Transcript_28106/m.47649 type:complete len:203 (-) Transcript_28106:62-670(-)